MIWQKKRAVGQRNRRHVLVSPWLVWTRSNGDIAGEKKVLSEIIFLLLCWREGSAVSVIAKDIILTINLIMIFMCCVLEKKVYPPLYFLFVSRLDFPCEGLESEMNHLFPAFSAEQAECSLQHDPLLFSCAGSSPKFQRLCPCRDYRNGQVALCRDCLWPEGDLWMEIISLPSQETLFEEKCSNVWILTLLPYLTEDWLPK